MKMLIFRLLLIGLLAITLGGELCTAQGYRLFDVEKVTIEGIGFDNNQIEEIEKKLGAPQSTFREYDEEMGVYKITMRYDSLSFEFTEVKHKNYLDYVEVLSPRYTLRVEDNNIKIGDRLEKLEKKFPLAYDNFDKNPDLAPTSKNVFKVYLKYDDGGKWIFYGKIIFKLKGHIVQSIYLVYSPEF